MPPDGWSLRRLPSPSSSGQDCNATMGEGSPGIGANPALIPSRLPSFGCDGARCEQEVILILCSASTDLNEAVCPVEGERIGVFGDTFELVRGCRPAR